jgi:hypothetical protein
MPPPPPAPGELVIPLKGIQGPARVAPVHGGRDKGLMNRRGKRQRNKGRGARGRGKEETDLGVTCGGRRRRR